MSVTPGVATQEYGTDVDWTFARGELFSSARRVTVKDLLAMGENDETIAAMFYAIETTLAQVNWRHEARDNGEDSADPKALEAAEFADSLLKDMETPLQGYIENAISYLVGGYSLAEINFRQRTMAEGSRFSDGLWGVRNLAERGQLTISQWIQGKDGKRVEFFRQATSTGKPVPLAKCMHLTVRGGPNRPMGRSMLKSAYRLYLLKRRIQDSEAIGIERDLCGLPVMDMPAEDIEAATNRPDTPDGKMAAARVKAAQAAVSDMRLNEAGGLILPSECWETEDGKVSSNRRYNFRIVTSAGSRSIDTRGAIREYDLAIARILMMQFLRLGDRAGGSYALSDTQSSLALRSIMAIVAKIAAEWQKKVLRTVWILNGMDLRYLPDLGTSSITEDSLESLGQFLESLASAKEILDEDEELSEDMKQRLGARRRRPIIQGAKKPVPEPKTEPVAA